MIIGFVVWGAISFRQRWMTTAQGQAFRLAKVTLGAIDVTVTGTGTVKPHRRWELSTKHGGKVIQVFAEPGQKVSRGQVLAQT